MWLFISDMLLLSAQYVNATSNYNISVIAQHAWPDAKPTAEGRLLTQHNQVIDVTGNSPQSAICRAWPARPELTLAAIPLMAQQYSDYDRIGGLGLLALDSANLDVRQRLRLSERMNDDTIQVAGLALDTACWEATPDQTTLGLRVARAGNSRVNPFSEDVLPLFVIKNNQLRAILNGVVLESNTDEQGRNYVETFHDTKRTLALAPDSHNGYFYTRVNERNMESTVYTDANKQCASKDEPGKTSWVLRYDGKQYAIPKELSPSF